MQLVDPKLLLDADVLRHLLKGEVIMVLFRLFPGRVYLPDMVEQELKRSKHLVRPVDNLLGSSLLQLMPFPDHADTRREYARLRKAGRGQGESACMAIARFSRDIIASSNLRDIKAYCNGYGIQYLTTMDVLRLAWEQNLLDLAACDDAIHKIRSSGSKLPYPTMQQYLDAWSHR